MKRTCPSVFNAQIKLKLKSHKCERQGTETSCCEAVNHLLEMYSTDDLVAETEACMMQFTQPSDKMPTEYTKALRNKEVR